MTLSIAIMVLFLVLLLAGVPVFISIGVSAVIGSYFLGEVNVLQTAVLTANSALSNFVLLAVPLYILAGTLLEQTKLSNKLFSFVAALTGRLRGGLGVATVIACAIFAAVSGSSVATAATIGLVAVPQLVKNGYNLERTGALIAGGGTLGILIPPSIALLLYGVLTDQSIGALFVAGLLPGLILACAMALFTIAANPAPKDSKPEAPAEDILLLAREAIPLLFLPILIFAGIYSGIATATEVAAIAVLYTLVVSFALRLLTLQKLYNAGKQAMQATVMILMLVAFGSLLTHFLTITQVPQLFTQGIADLDLGFFGIITIMVLFYLVLGMFLEALSMMLITIPIMFPLAMSIGFDPISFGIFLVLAIELAQITPPLGINLFVVSQIGQVPFQKLSIAILPYVLIIVLMMYLIAYFPALATWLPNTMEY